MMRKVVVSTIAWLLCDRVWLARHSRGPVHVRRRSGFSRTVYAQTPDPQAIVKQDRVTCHNQRLKTAGLELDALDAANVAHGAEIWEKVVRKVKTGMMPPSGMPRPDRAALDAFASELEARLDRAAVPGANLATPGVASAEPHRIRQCDS